jgi:hypothetical protein
MGNTQSNCNGMHDISLCHVVLILGLFVQTLKEGEILIGPNQCWVCMYFLSIPQVHGIEKNTCIIQKIRPFAQCTCMT